MIFFNFLGEQVSSSSLPKKESAGVKSKKKQPSGDRWSRAVDKKNFSSPWLLKTLKNHTGQVLNIDYSSSGKYLASCGEGMTKVLLITKLYGNESEMKGLSGFEKARIEYY